MPTESFEVKTDIRYNYVVVIESLPPAEPQTGEDLYNDIIRRRCEKKGILSVHQKVSDKEELFDTLNSLVYAVENKSVLPIIHFEVHGNIEGIQLANGDLVKWEELAESCRRINYVSRNQLCVSLATCKGASFYKLTDLSYTAPFWGYIGPKDDIIHEEFTRDFSDFYNTLLEHNNLHQALEALNLYHEDFKYAFLTAEIIFDLVYEQVQRNPFDKNAKFKRLFQRSQTAYPNLNRRQRRETLKGNIDLYDRETFLRRMKNEFLMREK